MQQLPFVFFLLKRLNYGIPCVPVMQVFPPRIYRIDSFLNFSSCPPRPSRVPISCPCAFRCLVAHQARGHGNVRKKLLVKTPHGFSGQVSPCDPAFVIGKILLRLLIERGFLGRSGGTFSHEATKMQLKEGLTLSRFPTNSKKVQTIERAEKVVANRLTSLRRFPAKPTARRSVPWQSDQGPGANSASSS